METFQYGNFTVTRQMIRQLFCTGEYPTEVVKSLFNVTCSIHVPLLFNADRSIGAPLPSTPPKSGLSTHYGRMVLVITSVIFVFGIIANLGLVTLLSTKKRFFKPSWYCVFNLVVADVLVLLNMAAFVTTMLLPKYPLDGLLKMFLFPSLDMFLSSASMLSVAIIALDRFFTVLTFKGFSRWYRTKNKLFVKVAILLTWFYCLVLFGLSLARSFTNTSENYNIIVFWCAIVVAFLGAIGVTAICYLSIACLYLKHRVMDAMSSQNTASMNLLATRCELDKGGCREPNASKKVTKALWVCIAPLPFLAGWCFYLGVQTYEMINDTYLDSKSLNMAMLFVPWAVSAFNPIMYFATQRALRKELYTLCCKRLFKACGGFLSSSEMQSETTVIV